MFFRLHHIIFQVQDAVILVFGFITYITIVVVVVVVVVAVVVAVVVVVVVVSPFPSCGSTLHISGNLPPGLIAGTNFLVDRRCEQCGFHLIVAVMPTAPIFG